MDKIKTIKIKNIDGTLEPGIVYIATDATLVDMSNGFNVQDVIGNINPTTDGSIQQQLEALKSRINTLEGNS